MRGIRNSEPKRVTQANGLKHSPDFMITIGPFAEHAKAEINLGESR
jgi:hypothetical protein